MESDDTPDEVGLMLMQLDPITVSKEIMEWMLQQYDCFSTNAQECLLKLIWEVSGLNDKRTDGMEKYFHDQKSDK